eukprot:gnl/TRDRNA2_/TRDRNA2_164495_c1_seq1.p1 gnl/TRDRNA2_/TRDRNA2_164495_c1~~gnl/TRDRNA2_/TRDRNA2_164495_c1_seq1.p1  ORF type:complete len:521 (+),score=44.71 gnl/TRDRNA2_/TRDRNA2_164495_c1_seq1:187-1563(+)
MDLDGVCSKNSTCDLSQESYRHVLPHNDSTFSIFPNIMLRISLKSRFSGTLTDWKDKKLVEEGIAAWNDMTRSFNTAAWGDRRTQSEDIGFSRLFEILDGCRDMLLYYRQRFVTGPPFPMAPTVTLHSNSDNTNEHTLFESSHSLNGGGASAGLIGLLAPVSHSKNLTLTVHDPRIAARGNFVHIQMTPGDFIVLPSWLSVSVAATASTHAEHPKLVAWSWVAAADGPPFLGLQHLVEEHVHGATCLENGAEQVHLFPTVLIRQQLPKRVVAADIAAKILDAYANFIKSEDPLEAEHEEGNSMFWEWQFKENWDKHLAPLKVIKRWKSALRPLALKYAQVAFAQLHGVRREMQVGPWASNMHSSQVHEMHGHPETLIAGTYYAAVPAGSGELYILDPREVGIPYLNRVVVEPRAGEAVLFPPWCMHSVGPTKGIRKPTSLGLFFLRLRHGAAPGHFFQ